MLIPARTGPAVAAGETRPWVDRIPPELVLLSIVTAIGLVIRAATLGTQSYWVDEATTVHDVSSSLGALLHQVHVNETTPPLYFIVAWVWAKLFGTGEVGLRSLSLVCGVATIPVAFLIARELVSRAAGLVAALLVALSPFMIWYSQEARSYALFALLCALSLLWWARAWRRPGARPVAGWAAFSALAIATHFFAGFLVAPEALLLLYRMRNRAAVLGCAAVAVVQAAVLPMAISDTTHPLGWIQTFPLSVRIKQVPVNFALSSLYQSPLVTRGLLGAAVVAAVVLVIVLAGFPRGQRSGIGLAAAIAGFVLIAPLVLAWLGRDYYVPRNLMPAWIPLAVVLGAACTAPRARVAGAALAVALVAGFVYGSVRIDANPQYQRTDWRGVAAALGRPATAARAIVAYDGQFAAEPLGLYLPGAPWPARRQTVSVGEVDVVGSAWQTPPARLPAGVRLLARQTVDGMQVARFIVNPAWRLTPEEIGLRAAALLPAGPPTPGVLIQRLSA